MAGRRGASEGTIFKLPDGRWRASLSLGYRNGKRWRKVFEAATRSEVQDKLSQALQDQKLGLPVATTKQTVGQFLNSWLTDAVKRSVKPKTHRTYSDLCRLHIVPVIGKRPLEKLSPQQVNRFLNDKLEAGLSPRSVAHLRATLRAALNDALKWGLVARNVAALVDAPKVKKLEMKVFTAEQARAFLEAAKVERLETLFRTALSLGCRQGEALGLQWQDVDLEAGILIVRRALQRIDGTLQLVPTKEDKVHTITLPAATVSALAAHRTRQQEERLIAGSTWRETDFVFTTASGTPLDARNVIRTFHRILKRAGLPKIRFHDLRHSIATLLLAQGVSPGYVKDLLGHSSVAFTLQTYGHVLATVKREVAAKIDEILNPVATSLAMVVEPTRVN